MFVLVYIVVVSFSIIAGAAIFDEWHKIMVGMVFGAAVSVLFMELARVRRRLKKLEARLLGQADQAALKTEAKPVISTEPEPGVRAAAEVPASRPAQVTPKATPASQSPKPQAKPGPAAKPTEPSPFWNFVRHMFMGVNTVVTIGVIILFFGVAFFLKYAIEQDMFSPEMRIISAALAGIVILVIGWRLRSRREGYALIMQGGGIGILYVTVFAALKLYKMFDPNVTFVFLVFIVLFATLLAIIQNSRTLAIMGSVGGFLAPILASTGSGNYVVLFSFYLLLNAGIFGVAWFRSWRFLNLIGFFFTFGVGLFWGVSRYKPELFSSVEPFLVAFFLFYVAIAVLYAVRQQSKLKGLVDGTLVFGTPLIAAGMQAVLVQPYAHGLSISAMTASLFYLGLAWFLFMQRKDYLRGMVESLLAIGVVFGTLAIPLELDARVTAAFWALEGLAIFWIGLRQQRLLPRIFAIVLQFGAGASFLQKMSYAENSWPVLNGVYLGCLIISLAGFGIAYLSSRKEKTNSAWYAIAIILFIWSALWWIFGGMSDIQKFVTNHYELSTSLFFFTGSALLFEFVGRRWQWSMLRYAAMSLLVFMVLHALLLPFIGLRLLTLSLYSHPGMYLGYLAWPLAFAAQYFILYRNDKLPAPFIIKAQHAASLWLLTFLAAWELSWWVNKAVQGAGTWPQIAWMLLPVAVLMYVSMSRSIFKWPLAVHRQTYLVSGLLPIGIALWVWSFVINLTANGNPWPLPYVPFLNPLDLAQAFVFVALLKWGFALNVTDERGIRGDVVKLIYGGIAWLVFVWLNAVLIRTFHYWGGIDLSYNAMFESVTVQTALSIFWSLLALGTMIVANRKRLRISWFVGAGLLVAVVLKLFVIDLSNSGTIARIVSFIAVGILLLVIGYFTPLPPKSTTKEVKQ